MPPARWMSSRRAPPNRRRFRHEWDRHSYVFSKASFWHRRGRRASARRWLPALRGLVRALVVENDRALLVWAGLALLAEARGDLGGAAVAQARLVDGLRRLLRSWPGCPDATPAHLVAELRALEDLHERRGDRAAARSVARRIRRARAKHRL